MSRVLDPTQLCTFAVGDLYLGIPVQHVQEVIRSLEMTPVPLAPATVRGLINLRGQIVTAIDLRTRLGLAPRASDADAIHIVVRTDDAAVSLLVDAVDDVLDVEHGTLESIPDHIGSDLRVLFRGVYKLDRRLLLLLDVPRTLSLDTVAA